MHNYEKKLARLLSEGKLLIEKGKSYDYAIQHDSWCRVYNGGECNCDPNIEATEITPENKKEVAERIDKETKEFRERMKTKIV